MEKETEFVELLCFCLYFSMKFSRGTKKGSLDLVAVLQFKTKQKPNKNTIRNITPQKRTMPTPDVVCCNLPNDQHVARPHQQAAQRLLDAIRDFQTDRPDDLARSLTVKGSRYFPSSYFNSYDVFF